MKKLQSDLTTPEQSKKLLELGVPADSANYVYDCALIGGEKYYSLSILEDKLFSVYKLKYEDDPYTDIIPCWSVGRLIEIFSKCYTGAKCYYSPRNLYKTEFWIERFNRLTIIGFIDYSKLEE